MKKDDFEQFLIWIGSMFIHLLLWNYGHHFLSQYYQELALNGLRLGMSILLLVWGVPKVFRAIETKRNMLFHFLFILPGALTYAGAFPITKYSNGLYFEIGNFMFGSGSLVALVVVAIAFVVHKKVKPLEED